MPGNPGMPAMIRAQLWGGESSGRFADLEVEVPERHNSLFSRVKEGIQSSVARSTRKCPSSLNPEYGLPLKFLWSFV